MSESKMLLNPDAMVKELYAELIRQWNENNLTTHSYEKLSDIIKSYAYDKVREEMDVVFRWMVL